MLFVHRSYIHTYRQDVNRTFSIIMRALLKGVRVMTKGRFTLPFIWSRNRLGVHCGQVLVHPSLPCLGLQVNMSYRYWCMTGGSTISWSTRAEEKSQRAYCVLEVYIYISEFLYYNFYLVEIYVYFCIYFVLILLYKLYLIWRNKSNE